MASRLLLLALTMAVMSVAMASWDLESDNDSLGEYDDEDDDLQLTLQDVEDFLVAKRSSGAPDGADNSNTLFEDLLEVDKRWRNRKRPKIGREYVVYISVNSRVGDFCKRFHRCFEQRERVLCAILPRLQC